MKVTFVGDPRNKAHEPDQISVLGIAFAIGVPVEIEDRAILAKLTTNSHFRVDGDKPGEQAPVAEGAAAADEIRVRAARLGIRIDGRWSEARIRKAVAEAEQNQGA